MANDDLDAVLLVTNWNAAVHVSQTAAVVTLALCDIDILVEW